jgi:Helix-turn-helix domain
MENRPNYYANIPANVRYDEDLSPNAKLLYGEITALTNAEGYCWATNKYFADLYKVSKVSISKWVKQLIEKGYISSEIIYKENSKEILHRYIRIGGEGHKEKFNTPSEEKFMTSPTKVNEGHKEKFNTPIKEKFKDNNTGFNTTLNITSNNKNTKKNLSSSELEKEFERLWKLYPRKLGKTNAQKFFIRARKKDKTSYEIIENGIYRYIDYLEAQGTEEQYIMHGSTWFGQMKWQDEYTTTGLNRKPKNATEYLQAKYGGNPNGSYGNRKIIDHDSEIISEFF